jgi:hypothetical protein
MPYDKITAAGGYNRHFVFFSFLLIPIPRASLASRRRPPNRLAAARRPPAGPSPPTPQPYGRFLHGIPPPPAAGPRPPPLAGSLPRPRLRLQVPDLACASAPPPRRLYLLSQLECKLLIAGAGRAELVVAGRAQLDGEAMAGWSSWGPAGSRGGHC